jgi:hypothetical protein
MKNLFLILIFASLTSLVFAFEQYIDFFPTINAHTLAVDHKETVLTKYNQWKQDMISKSNVTNFSIISRQFIVRPVHVISTPSAMGYIDVVGPWVWSAYESKGMGAVPSYEVLYGTYAEVLRVWFDSNIILMPKPQITMGLPIVTTSLSLNKASSMKPFWKLW